MCSVYVSPRSVQAKAHNLRLNIVLLYFVSALYLLNPLWVLQIICTHVSYDGTMRSAFVWPRSVQGKGHSLRFNIVWMYFVSALYLFNPLVGLTNITYAETMCSAYVWPRLVQGQGQNLRLNIIWLTKFNIADYHLKT